MALPLDAAGTFEIAGRTVRRLGFGAMRITGPGIWGPPKDHDAALRVLRRAVELGVNLIDTADAYGPTISEELICEALHPYGDVVVATKAGLVRTGPMQWHACGRPEYLRQQCELSIRRLGVDAIDLFQLHRVDPEVPAAEQFGTLRDLLAEGKVRSVGLSNVTVEHLAEARAIVPITTVQNRYNVADRASEDVLRACELDGIGFFPWAPVASGELAAPGSKVADMAAALGAGTSQVSLAWLLARSACMLPIPGTSSVSHLEENCASANLVLSADQLDALDHLDPR